MTVVSVDQAKQYLNISNSGDDALIASTIATAEAAIAERVGPLKPTLTTVRVAPLRAALRIPAPAVDIVSVVDSNGTVLTGSLHLDELAGLITADDGSRFAARWYDVTFTRGRATCPPDLIEAVKVLVKHLWGVQRGVGGRPGASASDGASNTIPGAGYLLPNRCSELIAPHMQIGVA